MIPARCCAIRTPGVPAAVFDDDAKAHGLSITGVPVVGSIEDIPVNASRYTLQQVLLAIPNPSPALVEKVLQSCEKAGLNLRILPSMSHIFNGSEAASSLRQARPPQIEDLLGRTPVPIDLVSVRQSFENHRVLVTGAGGSIGSEICRQVAELDPALLVLLGPRRDPSPRHRGHSKRPLSQALVDIPIVRRWSTRSTDSGPRWSSTPPATSTCRYSRSTP